ncbi:MAG: DUF421 domain-containing protein [Clostridia bacterium]|nr:DUF421 domain-containing protein [Clostridia bacterium]
MSYVQVILTAVLSVVVLFAITRLIGYRQLSELSLFDYINGITIGSIAAELATCEREELLEILIAMIIYGIFSILVAVLTDKSITMRRFIVGNPTLLMKNGRLYYEGFKKSHLDVNEFLMKCRNNGYFDITQIDTAILEPNGRVSFLPVSENRPVTPKDLKITVTQDMLVANVVIDGKIIEKSLDSIGKDRTWLLNRLKNQNQTDMSKILLASCDSKGTLTVYLKSEKKSDSCLGV